MRFSLFRRRQGRHTRRAVAARLAVDRLHAEALEYDAALTYAQSVDYDAALAFAHHTGDGDAQVLTLAEALTYDDEQLHAAAAAPADIETTVVIDRQEVVAAIRAG